MKLLFYTAVIAAFLGSCNNSTESTAASDDSTNKKYKIHVFVENDVKRFGNLQYTTKIDRSDINNAFEAARIDTTLSEVSADRAKDITLLGTGYNSVTGELLASGIIESPVIPDSAHSPFAELFKASMVRSYDELTKTMNVKAGASLGLSTFSASAKFQFLDELHSSSSNDYLVVKCFVKKYTRQFEDPMLTSKPLVVNKLNNFNTFFGYGGDEFVYQETFGGELYIVFSAQANSKQQKSENQTKISAATTFLGLGGSTNIKSAVNELSTLKNMQIYLYQNGGTPFDKDSLAVEPLLAFALDFPRKVSGAYALINFDTKQYQLVSNFPEGYQGDPDIEQEKKFMNRIVTKLLVIGKSVGDLGFVSRNGSLFRPSFPDSVRGVSDTLANRIQALQDCANHCRNAYSIGNCSSCAALNARDTFFSMTLPD